MKTRKHPDNRRRAEITKILYELRQARKKFPTWPEDVVHQVAIMAEEAGEAIQAALDYHYGRNHVEKLKTELRQTAAMCLRTLVALDEALSIRAYPRGAQT